MLPGIKSDSTTCKKNTSKLLYENRDKQNAYAIKINREKDTIYVSKSMWSHLWKNPLRRLEGNMT